MYYFFLHQVVTVIPEVLYEQLFVFFVCALRSDLNWVGSVIKN